MARRRSRDSAVPQKSQRALKLSTNREVPKVKGSGSPIPHGNALTTSEVRFRVPRHVDAVLPSLWCDRSAVEVAHVANESRFVRM